MDEVAQQIALRRGVERDDDGAELGQAPDGPEERRAVGHHDRDVIAPPDAERAEALGIAVGPGFEIGVAVALVAPEQERSVADTRGLVGKHVGDGAVFEFVVVHRGHTPR